MPKLAKRKERKPKRADKLATLATLAGTLSVAINVLNKREADNTIRADVRLSAVEDKVEAIRAEAAKLADLLDAALRTGALADDKKALVKTRDKIALDVINVRVGLDRLRKAQQ